MRSELTPVQRLNREGVDSIRKKQYDKAESLFYKAFLYDPADPFTLNNLGFIAELQGQVDRAVKFYALASEQGSNAVIDRSSARQLEGKPMREALGGLSEGPMRTNRMNVEASLLLSERRNDEAQLLLRQALELDPHNAFTLNNLGVAEEATGDYAGAVKYYDSAAAAGSSEPVVVTPNGAWRGRPVSEMAAASAAQLRERIRQMGASGERAAKLTLDGVSATNRNDWGAARQDFLDAYSLSPDSGFALNNRGYVAEKDGDLETAQFYYAKAQKAADASTRIGLASQPAAGGKRLSEVALQSDEQVNGKLDEYQESRRRQGRPVELKRRDTTPGVSSKPAPEGSLPPASQPH